MDNINRYTSAMLTEREIMTYMLIKSPMTLRDLGNRLGISYESIRETYKSAEEKMKKLTEAGLIK